MVHLSIVKLTTIRQEYDTVKTYITWKCYTAWVFWRCWIRGTRGL